jgi:hypothetical protein
VDNLQNYDEFINEGVLDTIKEKTLKLIKSFQNKEVFLRKLYHYAIYGTIPLSIMYIFLTVSKAWPQYFGGTDVKEFLASYGFIYWGIYILWLLSLQYIWYKLARRKLIISKLRKIRNDIANNEFAVFVCAVIGDRKNITNYLNKLKEDGVIDDKHILQTEDITLVDFSGTFKDLPENREKFKEVDPYGEEIWNEEGTGYEAYMSFQRYRLARTLESNYKVITRKITDVHDLINWGMKSLSKRVKERDKRYYDANIQIFRRPPEEQMMPENPNLIIPEPVPQDDENFDIEDAEAINWLQQKREEGDVEDLPDGRVAVKVKKPKRKIINYDNFVVPGFDIKPPEVEKR